MPAPPMVNWAFGDFIYPSEKRKNYVHFTVSTNSFSSGGMQTCASQHWQDTLQVSLEDADTPSTICVTVKLSSYMVVPLSPNGLAAG